MAIIDKKLELSDAQATGALTYDTTEVVSDFVSDLGAPGSTGWSLFTGSSAKTMDIGEGGVLELNVEVQVALVGAASVLEVMLYTSASTASLAVATATKLCSIFIPALSAAGYRASIKVPAGSVLRYLGLIYMSRTASLTSSTINAWIGMDHRTASISAIA